MKKQYKFLIIIFIILQFLFTGCNLQKNITVGPGTEEGISFDSLSEFKENFAEFMAFPAYIPMLYIYIIIQVTMIKFVDFLFNIT